MLSCYTKAVNMYSIEFAVRIAEAGSPTASNSHAPVYSVWLAIQLQGHSIAKVSLYPARAVKRLQDIACMEVLVHQALAVHVSQACSNAVEPHDYLSDLEPAALALLSLQMLYQGGSAGNSLCTGMSAVVCMEALFPCVGYNSEGWVFQHKTACSPHEHALGLDPMQCSSKGRQQRAHLLLQSSRMDCR